MKKKLFLTFISLICLFFTGRFFYLKHLEKECQKEIARNHGLLKDLVDLGSLIVGQVKYQNPQLQSQNDIKEFVSIFLKMKKIFEEDPSALYTYKEDLFYYLEVLPLILKNGEYFTVHENKDRPSISYTELLTQVAIRTQKLKSMDSCH